MPFGASALISAVAGGAIAALVTIFAITPAIEGTSRPDVDQSSLTQAEIEYGTR